MGKLWDLIQSHMESATYKPTERAVAARLGVSQTTLQGWREMKGGRLPRREYLEAIADLVGVRYSVVLDAALYDSGYHESAQVIPIRKRPRTTIEADLSVARADLDDWRAQNLTGRDAESHEQLLRSRVDALEAELVASRSAADPSGFVAES